jgi:CRP-like cAMP-binding protein
MSRTEPPARPPENVAKAAARLAAVDLFSSLTSDERHALAEDSAEKVFASDEVVVRQGAPGASMFVILTGRARVVLEPSRHEVASIDAGGFFGEMSMLTGEPRTATVSARGDMTTLEITAERFRQLALDRPELVEHVSTVIAARRAGLEDARAAVAAASAQPVAARQTLLERIQRFLRLP